MSAYLQSFIDGLRASICIPWSEVADTGVWEDTQIEDVPFGDLLSPYVAILVNGLEEADWGADAQTYECLVEIWRFQPSQGEGYSAQFGATEVRAKLEILRDYLWTNELAVGQMLTIERLDWSSLLAPNVYFKSFERPFSAGMIAARMLVGESP